MSAAHALPKLVASDRRFLAAAVAAFAFLALTLVPCQSAYASIADDINAWLCGLLRDCCNWIFGAQVDVLKSIGYSGILGADFEGMLATSGTISTNDIAHSVWQVAILPIGCGVLSLVFTVKLIQTSQRMDGTQSLPGVKDVVFMLVFFAVFLFLIQNSFEIMKAIYEVVGLAIDRVIGLFGTGGSIDLAGASIVTQDDDIPALVAMLVVSLISWLVVLIAYIVALVVCWARALQLYIMAAFAPIPLSLMALDDTRQIGIGYLKNFTAVCLAGLIILILLISFPIILGGLVSANPGTGTPIDGIAGGLTYALQYLAMCILLILSLVKSGTWARDIVSGF
ncbi:MAG: conjugal transfer protein TrbL [Gordonibacter urolithinfaciens]